MKLKRFCASLLLLILPLSLAVSGCDAEEDNDSSNSNVTSATQNTELKTNFTQPNQIADNAYAAEAYYQQLIAQYGENYQECLEPVAVNLDAAIDSNSPEADTNSDLSTLKKIETEKYSTAQLRENRTQTPTSTAPNLNQIIACTTVKMNRELGQIITQVNRLSTIQGANPKYNNHVLARLKERQERIAVWRDRLLTNASNPQLDLNLFRQELAQATQ